MRVVKLDVRHWVQHTFTLMGNLWSYFKQEKGTALLLGLPGAGKSTIMRSLGDKFDPQHDIGCYPEQVRVHGIRVFSWDIGGQEKLIPLWKFYWAQAIGIIFVIDASNPDWANVEHEIDLLMGQDTLVDCPFLFLLNQRGVSPNPIPIAQVEATLSQRVPGNRHFRVRGGNELDMCNHIDDFLLFVKSNPRELPPIPKQTS